MIGSFVVSVGNIYCLDASTGVLTTCAQAFPTWNAGTNTCSNMLSSLEFSFTFTTSDAGESTLTTVVANLILTNRVLASGDSVLFSFTSTFNEVRLLYMMYIV